MCFWATKHASDLAKMVNIQKVKPSSWLDDRKPVQPDLQWKMSDTFSAGFHFNTTQLWCTSMFWDAAQVHIILGHAISNEYDIIGS